MQLSDLLNYEEAVALKDLAKESREESHQMRQLTVRTFLQNLLTRILNVIQERSTQDATSVKILTLIFLIYLPLTIVAVQPLQSQSIRSLDIS